MGQACCDTRTSEMGLPEIVLGSSRSMPELAPLNVASLNYATHTLNHFQYHSSDLATELEELDTIFQSLLSRYFPDYEEGSFQWKCQQLAKKVQNERYSPLFDLWAGIDGTSIMGRAQFEDKWDQVFNEAVAQKQIEYGQDERENLRLFDTMVFHALLEYCFEVGSINDAQFNDYHEYIIMVRPFHNLTHIDPPSKLRRFIQGYEQLQADLFVVQNPSTELIQHFKEKSEYLTAEDTNQSSFIIARNSSFKQLRDSSDVTQLPQKVTAALNPEQKTAFLCVDQVVVIATQLSHEDSEQQQNFKQGLLELLYHLPERSLIAAGDFGGFLEIEEESLMSRMFEHYPAHPSDVTSRLKPTHLQTNLAQANQIIEDSSSQILTTLNMGEPKVTTLREEESLEKTLPQVSHPFEHFLVRAKVHGK